MKQKIVTIGGGTGSFVVLSGLKKYPINLTAIISMADNGGSTGMLRNELGVLPPGDIRQGLIALLKTNKTFYKLLDYRYEKGSLRGHNFGNIFLSTLELVLGDFNKALKELKKILNIKAEILPVTLTDTNLEVLLKSGKKIKGEANLHNANLKNIKNIKLYPAARANSKAIKAIREADKIIINPGNIYCSIIPNFLVENIRREIVRSKAKKIYICNLMTKRGQTDNYRVGDFVNLIEQYLDQGVLDYVVYNKEIPPPSVLKKYSHPGEEIVKVGKLNTKEIKFLGYNLLSHEFPKKKRGDKLIRTAIRHNSAKLAKIIYNL